MNKNQQARLDRLVQAANSHELDWILCTLPENIFYFSGFRTTFYTRFVGVLVPTDSSREPVLTASFIDRQLIETDLWSQTWFTNTAIWGPGSQYATHWDVLKEHLTPGVRLGVDAIQLDFYQQLQETFAGIEVINLTDEILNVRTVKDEDEIATIKKAFALAEDVMDHVPGWLQQPITEAELAAELNYCALKSGAEDIFYPTLVSGGEKMLAFHSPPLDRPIKKDELVRIAFGLQLDGYGSDIVRHFCIGTMPEELEPLRHAYYEGRQLIADTIRPGLDTGDLLKLVGDRYRELGVYDHWLQNIGHGIALTIHEFPRIAGADRTVLRENMVLAIEPILALPPYGAIAHCDGLRVTADGCEWISGKITDVTTV